MYKNFSLVSIVAFAVLALLGGPAWATNFCDDNPGHVSCRQQTPAQTQGQGQSQGAYGGHASAGAAAGAIAGALAENDVTTVQQLWSSLTAAQQTQVRNSLRLTNDQQNRFEGAVTGILRTGDANFSGLGSGNNTSVKLVTKGSLGLSSNTAAGADGKTGEMREGDCGPLLDISGWKVYENYTVSYTLGGVFPVRDLVRTAVGSFPDGIPKFDRKQKYRVEIHNLDASERAEQGDEYVQGWTRYGHKLTKISSVVGTSGSSKATLQRGESGNTADFANAGAGGMPQYGYLVEECKVKDGYVKRPPVTLTGTIPPMVPLADLERLEEQRAALALRLDQLQREKSEREAAKPADDSDILFVREKVVVPPKGVTWNVRQACALPGANCTKNAATPGSVTERERAIDCRRPANQVDADTCAKRKAQVGKPEVVETAVIDPTKK